MPPVRPLSQEISLSVIKTACSNCNLRELCLPFGLSIKELERLDDLVSTRRRIKRGDQRGASTHAQQHSDHRADDHYCFVGNRG